MSFPAILALSDAGWIAIIGTIGGAIITAVVGPILIAIVNHLIAKSNADRKLAAETISTLVTELDSLKKKVNAMERRGRSRKDPQ